MRNLLTTLLICAMLVVLPSCANEPTAATGATPAETAEDVTKVIEGLEREWVAAIVNKDLVTLDRLLAEEFNGTSPTGSTFPKKSAIEDLKAGGYVVKSMDLDEVSVNAYGTTAVAFTSQNEVSQYDGKDISGHYHYTNVWVKRDGRWQVVASHGSPLVRPK